MGHAPTDRGAAGAAGGQMMSSQPPLGGFAPDVLASAKSASAKTRPASSASGATMRAVALLVALPRPTSSSASACPFPSDLTGPCSHLAGDSLYCLCLCLCLSHHRAFRVAFPPGGPGLSLSSVSVPACPLGSPGIAAWMASLAVSQSTSEIGFRCFPPPLAAPSWGFTFGLG
jgi:hypothetical protein